MDSAEYQVTSYCKGFYCEQSFKLPIDVEKYIAEIKDAHKHITVTRVIYVDVTSRFVK